jgi:hypothetical protein
LNLSKDHVDYILRLAFSRIKELPNGTNIYYESKIYENKTRVSNSIHENWNHVTTIKKVKGTPIKKLTKSDII